MKSSSTGELLRFILLIISGVVLSSLIFAGFIIAAKAAINPTVPEVMILPYSFCKGVAKQTGWPVSSVNYWASFDGCLRGLEMERLLRGK